MDVVSEDVLDACKNEETRENEVSTMFMNAAECSIPSSADEEKFLPRIPKKESSFVFFTFVALGTSALAFCNLLFYVVDQLPKLFTAWKFPFNNSLIAIYCTASTLTTAVLIAWFPGVRPIDLVGSLIAFAVTSLAFAFTCTVMQMSFGSIIIHLLCCIGGVLTAVYQNCMFGAASILPKNYMGAASFGLGACGLLGFGAWITATHLLFDKSTLSGFLRALWVHTLVICVPSNILGLLVFQRTRRFAWVKQTLNHGQPFVVVSEPDELSVDAKGSELTATSLGPETKQKPFLTSCCLILKRYRDALEQIFSVSLTLFVTFLVYPSAAPYAWRMTANKQWILVGIFHVGDFAGRYVPNLRHWCPRLTVRRCVVKYLALLRIAFIPVILYPVKHPTATLAQSFIFCLSLIILFSLSNGWICSLSSVYLPETVVTQEEKHRAATLYLLLLLSATSAGAWMSKLVV